MNTQKENIHEIIDLVLKAIGLAMSVAVVTLNALHVLSPEEQIPLLGIGLFTLAITALDNKEKPNE